MRDKNPESIDQNALLQRLETLERENQSLRAELKAQSTESDAAAVSTAEKVQEDVASVASGQAQKLAAASSRIKELKQARNSLRASEGWLRAILESATDYAIITLDLNGAVTNWNSGARNILGWEESEVLGRDGAFIFTPEDREAGAHRQEMEKALTEGRALDERWHLKKDGTRFWGNGILTPFRDGELQGYLKILRDQTEQRQAEDELRRFGLIVESMSEGVSLTTADGTIVYTNPAEDRMFGYLPSELLGQSVTIQNAYLPEENERRVSAVIEQLRTTGRWDGEWRNIRKDGTEFVTASRITAVEINGATHWLCVQRDVTKDKQAEAAIVRGQERLWEILESISDAFYAVDKDWRFTYINRKTEEIWGRRRDDLIGKVYWEEFPQAVDSGPYKAHQQAMQERRPVRLEAMSPIVKYWVDISIFPTADGGLSVYFRDISERRKAEEHQRLLINELNHRVKNTLATVQSVASQTLRNAPTAEAAKEAIENRLIALSRAHDVLTRENWEGAYLREIVQQAVEPYRWYREGRFDIRGADVRLSPRIALAVSMAFQELVTNAVKYGALSNETGRVMITWALTGQADTPSLELRWEEAGGPPVQVPSRRGFGTRMIERSLAQELGGKAEIQFESSGIICTIVTPLAVKADFD
jgi:PAS domain S-box-containing protein